MTAAASTERPLCGDLSRAAGEGIDGTASVVEHWLLIEYGGLWPYEPLDAAPFLGGLGRHLQAVVAELPRTKLCLVKRRGRPRDAPPLVFLGRTRERGSWLRRLQLENHGDLRDLQLVEALRGEVEVGEPLGHPLLLVCTHGKRDRCCARYGQPLCEGISAAAPDGWAWQATHVGGDRFAGNLVALPEGLYYGRVGRRDARRVLDAHLAGRLDLEHLRGRSCYGFGVQAAELEVRRRTGLDGLWDLRLRGRRRLAAERVAVTFESEVAGELHEVEVRMEEREEALLTCRGDRPRRAPRWSAA